MNGIIYSLKRLAGRIIRLIEMIVLGLKGLKFWQDRRSNSANRLNVEISWDLDQEYSFEKIFVKIRSDISSFLIRWNF